MLILEDPGVLVGHEEAAGLFNRGGARVKRTATPGLWAVSIPRGMVERALSTAPQVVRLGARDPAHALLLDGRDPCIHFGSGSESNFILDLETSTWVCKDDPAREGIFPTFKKKRGTVADLCRAAHLAENLEHLDFFIRPINIQDEEITEQNKDVNKFFACLDNTSKHVMAGLTDVEQLDHVLHMAEIVAGGRQALQENPVISFITCVVKSPLELVSEATERLLRFCRRRIPVVISSSPQGGSTAPIEELGMVSQINAEILSAVVLSQLAAEGAPVIYGSVPVRARMDNLHDMYGAPEFNQYNIDCVQMARFYGLPCYSTAGVADAKVPGIQSTVEKTLSHLFMAHSGAHLIHYAFGLLEETQTFSLEQAILDNLHIGLVKMICQEPQVNDEAVDRSLAVIRKVMASSIRLFARYTRRKLHAGELFIAYPFEGDSSADTTLLRVKEELERIDSLPAKPLPAEIRERIFREVPGLLERLRQGGATSAYTG